MIGNKKINIALIGVGGMGKRWAESLANMRAVSVRVVCDKDRKRAQAIAEQFSHCRAETDMRAVARANDIDMAIIVLPHTLLSEASCLFLTNKKHVLCEKPGGVSSREVQKAIALARKNNVLYAVGYNHRFHDAFLKARKQVDAGAIGDVLFIRARYGFGGRKNYHKEWRLNKKQGGGELLDQGVHMIDLVLWFLGNVAEVRGFTGNLFWGGTAEDNAFVLLKNRKGKLASIHMSLSMWKANHVFEIYGTKGYLVIDGLGRKYVGDYGGGEKLIVGHKTKDFKAKEKIVLCDTDADKSLARELQSFIGAMRIKKRTGQNGENAVRALEIVETIYEQNKEKK